MLKTVRDACTPSPLIFDYRMAEGIENLGQLIRDQGAGADFFARNHLTQGMEELFREGLLRLGGKSDQAVFELSQAMGGGKTHLMIALGLLARHPERRREIVPELAQRSAFGSAGLAAFNGRNNPDRFIWGEIAEQLGKGEEFRRFWIDGPKAVDEQAWKHLIGDHPTLILLDELPPYLAMANARPAGAGTLADIVTYSLGTLLTAAMQLPRCCVVIANLSGSYERQNREISRIVHDLQQETRRQARAITPVQLASDEIYQILKKRLFDQMADEQEIEEVAEAYVEQVKRAEAGGFLTARSMEQVAEEVRATYPFHPSFKHLVALFKENEDFRQTRGLMQFAARLLKSVWERDTNDVFLAGTQHLNLNDPMVRDEVAGINNALLPAIATDIADNGNAHAEEIDDALNGDGATQVAKLLLSASLSRAVKAHRGLTEEEAIEFLVAPNRKPGEFAAGLERLRAKAWYLHREGEAYYFKETENLTKRIEKEAERIPAPKVEQALINHLSGLLQPRNRLAYQEIQILPRLDEVKLTAHRVLLVVEPDGRTPPEAIRNFFEFQQEKNNLLILSGNDSYLSGEVETRLRELYAIERILKELRPGDSLYEEATEKQEELRERFLKAVAGTYNRLFFPGGDGELVMATIDNGLSFGQDEYSAERQIERLLSSTRCDLKLALNYADELINYWAMAEQYLWPQNVRRTPWRDVLMRAKTDPSWPWMPGAKGLETLKTKALEQGRWREGADGHIEKGPFPKEKTGLNVTPQNVVRDSEESTLTLTPRNAGPSPRIHYAAHAGVSESDPLVEDPDNLRTTEPTLYFLVVDSEGAHQTGDPVRWKTDISIRHQIRDLAGERKIEIQALPVAEIRYSLDGANPKMGPIYQEPVAAPPDGGLLQVYAVAGEAEKTAQFKIPPADGDPVRIDDDRPLRVNETRRISLDDTEKAFRFIQRFRDNPETWIKGAVVNIGEGETGITLRFNAREVTAGMLEQAIQALRKAIGEEQARVQITARGGMRFRNGHEFKEFARDAELEIRPEDILQDDV